MRHAETVTFGGSGLDRAAELRGDATALGLLWEQPKTEVLVLWRGKPLCLQSASDQTPSGLVYMKTSDVLVAERRAEAIFLGRRDDVGGYFAVDISAWQPPAHALGELGNFFDPSLQHHPELPETHVFAELRSVMVGLTPREAELAATARALLGWHETHLFCAKCGAPSALEEAGWQRKCPKCDARHFPRTDPVVIMLITHGDRVLVGRSPGWPEGMFSLLAGFVEPGETLEAAVRREVFEEAGVRVGQVSYLASQPWAFPMSLMFGCAGQALNDDIQIDPNEIEEAIWLTRQEVMDVFAGQHPKVRPARKGAIAHFLLENWLADTLG